MQFQPTSGEPQAQYIQWHKIQSQLCSKNDKISRKRFITCKITIVVLNLSTWIMFPNYTCFVGTCLTWRGSLFPANWKSDFSIRNTMDFPRFSISRENMSTYIASSVWIASEVLPIITSRGRPQSQVTVPSISLIILGPRSWRHENFSVQLKGNHAVYTWL